MVTNNELPKRASSTSGLNRIGRSLFRRKELKRSQSDSVLNKNVLPDCAFVAVPSASPPRAKLTRLRAAILQSTFVGRAIGLPPPPSHHQSLHHLPVPDAVKEESGENWESINLDESDAGDAEVGGSRDNITVDIHHAPADSTPRSPNRLSPLGQRTASPRATQTVATSGKDANKPAAAAAAGSNKTSYDRHFIKKRDELSSDLAESKALLLEVGKHKADGSAEDAKIAKRQIDLYEVTQRKQDELIRTLQARCHSLEMERQDLYNKNVNLAARNESLQKVNHKLAAKSSQIDSVQDNLQDLSAENVRLSHSVTSLRREHSTLAGEKDLLERQCRALAGEKDLLERRLELLQEEEGQLRQQTASDRHEKKLIKDHTKLVLRENDLLTEKVQGYDSDLHTAQLNHQRQMSLVQKKYDVCEAERRALSLSLQELRERYGESVGRCEALLTSDRHKVARSEHVHVIQGLNSKVEELELAYKSEVDQVALRHKAVNEEKNRVTSSLIESEDDKRRLSGEVHTLQEILSEVEQYVAALEVKVEELSEIEHVYKSHLHAVITLAESAMKERQELAQQLHTHEKLSAEAKRRLDRDSVLMGKMGKKVVLYKENVRAKLKEQDNDHNTRIKMYERSVNQLKAEIDERQGVMEALLSKNRHTENNLELMWQQIMVDNERMKRVAY